MVFSSCEAVGRLLAEVDINCDGEDAERVAKGGEAAHHSGCAGCGLGIVDLFAVEKDSYFFLEVYEVGVKIKGKAAAGRWGVGACKLHFDREAETAVNLGAGVGDVLHGNVDGIVLNAYVVASAFVRLGIRTLVDGEIVEA